MSDADDKDETRRGWLVRRTAVEAVLTNLLDEPATGAAAWTRTFAGIVALLLAIQLFTGVLLAFYYVPSDGSAHATVAYMEKALAGGSFLRSLHFYGSQLLPLAIVLHLAGMCWRGADRRKPVGWLVNVLLLSLVLANGATGYSLPWDARAFFSTQVASNIAGGFPLIGPYTRAWLVGGADVSTLTLSRFYALHVIVVPAALLLTVVARLFVFKESSAPLTASPMFDCAWARAQLTRNSVVIGIVFAALSVYAGMHPAPLGPAAESAPAGYLPRPGAQFIWLFQLLKYAPASVASMLALFVPGILLGALALLPLLNARSKKLRRGLALSVFASGTLLVAGLSLISYLEDARDPRIRERLAAQSRQEEEFRNSPFVPLRATTDSRLFDDAGSKGRSAQDQTGALTTPSAAPAAFLNHCAKCHGENGAGKSIYPPLTGVSRQPRRAVEDIIAIINNPSSYGLEQRMPSFANKLTEEEKRAIAIWVASL